MELWAKLKLKQQECAKFGACMSMSRETVAQGYSQDHFKKDQILEGGRGAISSLLNSIEYPIQLVAACIIHPFQGLTFDFLAFDPSRIHHHKLTYTTLFHVRKKENLYLLTPLVEANFKVDKCVSNEM